MSLMSQQDGSVSSVSNDTGSSWVSIAFMVESILLLVFLVASLAVLTQVFSSSLNRSVESRTLDAAVIAASSVAEHFAADPEGIDEEIDLGDLRVSCALSDQQRSGGTMYYADINVYDVSDAGNGELVYTLSTSAYRSGVS